MPTTRKRNGRRLRKAETDLTCGRCRMPIPAGHEHVRDVSGSAQHPACVRLGITAAPLERPHVPTVVVLADVPRPCDGCGDDTRGEPAVTVNGRPWHRECRRRDQRRE